MSRSRMIRFSPLIALLASSFATAHAQDAGDDRAAVPRGNNPAPAARAAQPGPSPAQPVNDPVKMKWLLEKWEGQSAKLKSLDVKIYRIDKDSQVEGRGSLRGAGRLQEPQPGLPGLLQDQDGAECQGTDGPGDQSQERTNG